MRQLTGVDAAFLAWESPTTTGHVTSVLLLDPATAPVPWTFERFAAHLADRVAGLAPLNEKLQEVPLGLDRPYWVPDPAFRLEHHLHHVAVPAPGGRHELAELVARIHEKPLDRSRPLWECHVVRDLAAGAVERPEPEGGPSGDDRRYVALITKIHHAAIDGLSGQEILAHLVDLSPTAPAGGPSALAALVGGAGSGPGGGPGADTGAGGGRPGAPMGNGQLLARAAVSIATSPRRLARTAADVARALPVLGAAVGRRGPGARGDETAFELLRRFGAAPPTPFNAMIGPHRRWAYESVSLAGVKAVKAAAGCTVNDVVLALVAGVLRDWLAARGALPDRPLTAMVPLSVRRPGQEAAVGNFLSPTVATLATHLADPAERLAAIAAGMGEAKRAQAALPADILTDLTQVAPPALAALAARLVASTRLADRVTLPFNLVVSNIPGPPIPLYLAGALILGHFPVSTVVDGVGLNITVVSTNGLLDFGLVADRDLVPDLWDLADRLPAALTDLAAAVGAPLPTPAAPEPPRPPDPAPLASPARPTEPVAGAEPAAPAEPGEPGEPAGPVIKKPVVKKPAAKKPVAKKPAAKKPAAKKAAAAKKAGAGARAATSGATPAGRKPVARKVASERPPAPRQRPAGPAQADGPPEGGA